MKTLNVLISESEFDKLGLKSTEITFSDLLDVISRELAVKRLEESVRLAKKYDLSKVTMDEINEEVKAIRKNAKGHS